jgi:S1-C subfamily serine protease
MARFAALFLLMCPALNAQTVKPITQIQACQKFSPAIVGIHAKTVVGNQTNWSHGTGFIVSADGLILTAGHVVFNEAAKKDFESITVTLADDSEVPATILIPPDQTRPNDFALLKVDKSNLPFLVLGDEKDAVVGSEFALIGFPYSTGTAVKFCLSGNIAAKVCIRKGDSQINVIYFQGVSVKGISGAPLVSLASGKVIGIENMKLAGITQALAENKEKLGPTDASMGGVIYSGVNYGAAISNIIDTLSTQLANGLGAGQGISAARLAVEKSRKQQK